MPGLKIHKSSFWVRRSSHLYNIVPRIIVCTILQQSSCGSIHETMSRRDSSIKDKLNILETIVKESVAKRDHKGGDDDEVNDSILDLVYRKDGIADLEFITLLAQNAEIASVSF